MSCDVRTTLKGGLGQEELGMQEDVPPAQGLLPFQGTHSLQPLLSVCNSLPIQGGFPSSPAPTRLFRAHIPLGWDRGDHPALSLCPSVPLLMLGRRSQAASPASTFEQLERKLCKMGGQC